MFEFVQIEWIKDALLDSFKALPFLFLIFLFIEFFEYFFADKIKRILKHSEKTGPILGSVVSSIPQCGFSVIASTLYCENFLTKGTIIAVFLATSDEAIPVLLTYPNFSKFILPLIAFKILIAIPIGYLVDIFFKNRKENPIEDIEHIEGCCKHDVTLKRKRDFLFHPIHHTLSVFVFILVITLFINFVFEFFNISDIFQNNLGYIAPLFTSIIGLIPNCAISVGLCLMFIKGVISFGALVSGLLTSSGIGLLVLLKNNKNKKDTLLILWILLLTGFLSGLFIQIFSELFF